jgi:hypothetical protein
MQQSEENANWKIYMLAIGTVMGAVIGGGTAYLMARKAEEKQSGPPKIEITDALRIGINGIGLIRGIVALSDK